MNLVLISYWNNNKIKWAYVTRDELVLINLIRVDKGLLPATIWEG